MYYNSKDFKREISTGDEEDLHLNKKLKTIEPSFQPIIPKPIYQTTNSHPNQTFAAEHYSSKYILLSISQGGCCQRLKTKKKFEY